MIDYAALSKETCYCLQLIFKSFRNFRKLGFFNFCAAVRCKTWFYLFYFRKYSLRFMQLLSNFSSAFWKLLFLTAPQKIECVFVLIGNDLDFRITLTILALHKVSKIVNDVQLLCISGLP